VDVLETPDVSVDVLETPDVSVDVLENPDTTEAAFFSSSRC